MKFTFTCKKVPLNDSIKEYAEKKISKLDKYFREEAEAFVIFSVEKRNRCLVEVTLRGADGTLYRASCEDSDGDMRSAIDDAASFIDRKIRKNKTRLAKKLRETAFEMPASLPEEDYEEDPGLIIRTKQFEFHPMSPEEAIMQMNLLGHNFYVFNDITSGDTCVVYTRKDGTYGLIEPMK